MKRIFIIVALALFASACISTRGVPEKAEEQQIIIDPLVKQWLTQPHSNPDERLTVIIVTHEELTNVTFVKKIKDGYYTGQLSFEELKQLILDTRVKRIASGEQTLHK